jgi:hypothetical protein
MGPGGPERSGRETTHRSRYEDRYLGVDSIIGIEVGEALQCTYL